MITARRRLAKPHVLPFACSLLLRGLGGAQCGAAPPASNASPQPLERGVVPVLGSPPLDGVGHRGASASAPSPRLRRRRDAAARSDPTDSAEGWRRRSPPCVRRSSERNVTARSAGVEPCAQPARLQHLHLHAVAFSRCSTASSASRSTWPSSPSAMACVALGWTPDHLTIAGLVVGVGAAFAIGLGYLQLGLFLVVLAALPDLLDGALAKASSARPPAARSSTPRSTGSPMPCCSAASPGTSPSTSRPN